MAVTPADLKAIAPELASETDPRLQLFIDLATDSVNLTAFGTRADKAVALLAAHFTTMANREGAGGSVSSESLGDWSRSYSTANTRDSELNSTAYGQLFITLMKSLGMTMRVLSGGSC